MYVAITLGTCTLKFYPPNTTKPAGVALPWLLSAGSLRETAAIGAGELPSFTCALDNSRGQVAAILALPQRLPLEYVDDAGEVQFAGVIARVGNNLQYTITAES